MRARLSNLFLDGRGGSEEQPTSQKTEPYTLLMVDDEENILSSLKRMFNQENYRILAATSAEEGLKILEKEEVQVVLSDHRMPGMTGAAFLGKVKELYPNTIRLMLTGYADISSVMGAINTGAVYKFITKPWNDEDLRITVSLAFEQHDLLSENKELKKQAKKRHQEIKKLTRYVEINRSTLLNILINNELINQDQREKIQKAHQKNKKPYPQLLDEFGYISFTKIASLLKNKLGIETIAPKEYDPPRELLGLFPEDFCRRNWILPMKMIGKTQLLLAMADSTDYALVEDIRFITGLKITPALARLEELKEALNKSFEKQVDASLGADITENLVDQMIEYDPYETIEVVLEDEESDSVDEIIKDSLIPPAVRLVNLIFWEALKARASDIHIEKRTKNLLVRFRIDGLLENRISIPDNLHQALVSRLKIMADLDIAERRRPQDGRITIKARSQIMDVRISVLPTIAGEKVVMRLLERNSDVIELKELGVDDEYVEKLRYLVHKPQGMILTTGPTSAGKTTTLYALLHDHSNPNLNYITIEDPVEYFLEYAGQVLVKNKIGLNFSTILRSILRQDPNVILLGEIRDFETAEVAFHAALTGHLVLSSVHTNSTVATIARLLDLGVKPYIISSALEGIIAQRLVRRLCPHCQAESEPDLKALKLLGNPEVVRSFESKGCGSCNNTGFSGRVGIFEILVPDQEMKKLIAKGFMEDEFLRLAKLNGMKTLLEGGIDKVNQGITSLGEILRILGPQEINQLSCPSCEAPIKQWTNFCSSCGAKVKSTCPDCGARTEHSWEFCSDCGNQLHLKQRKIVPGTRKDSSRIVNKHLVDENDPRNEEPCSQHECREPEKRLNDSMEEKASEGRSKEEKETHSTTASEIVEEEELDLDI